MASHKPQNYFLTITNYKTKIINLLQVNVPQDYIENSL